MANPKYLIEVEQCEPYLPQPGDYYLSFGCPELWLETQLDENEEDTIFCLHCVEHKDRGKGEIPTIVTEVVKLELQ